MKKLVLIALLLCSARLLFAQQVILNAPGSATEVTAPVPGSYFDRIPSTGYPLQFTLNLGNGNKALFQFRRIAQLDSLGDLTAHLQKIKGDFSKVADSVSDPLAARRIDYVYTRMDQRMRVLTHAPRGESFRFKDGAITQLKVEQDTLNIFRSTVFHQRLSDPPPPNAIPFWHEWYKVSLVLNNLDDLDSLLASGVLSSGLELIRTDVARDGRVLNHGIVSPRFEATYDAVSGKRIFPLPKESLRYSRNSLSLPPYVQTGIQYGRGAWTPSAGIGLALTKDYPNSREQLTFSERRKKYILMWEPYFVFDRDLNKKLVLQRNDFITFKYSSHSVYQGYSRQVQFDQTMSIGYLIRRKGEFFEKNTFKFTLPGLQAKNILLEPEFFFNDLFRNFSPSLKLVLQFE